MYEYIVYIFTGAGTMYLVTFFYTDDTPWSVLYVLYNITIYPPCGVYSCIVRQVRHTSDRENDLYIYLYMGRNAASTEDRSFIA